MKRVLRIAASIAALLTVAVVLIVLHVQFAYADKIYSPFQIASLVSIPVKPNMLCASQPCDATPPNTCNLEDLCQSRTAAVVLGASVNRDGTPSDALRDRLDVAAELYRRHAVSLVVLTGDDGKYHEDEIDAMKSYITAHGVAAEDLLVDGTGYRTYESCKHLPAMGITNAVLVTQRFHMARALYLCNALGVRSTGVTSDLENYQNIIWLWTRDLLSSWKAWFDVNIWPPKPPV